MIKLFKKKVNETKNFKQLLEANINNIIELWCLVKWCDYNKSYYCYYHHFIEKQRKEWANELFELMWSICKIKVKNKSDIINDVFIKNGLKNPFGSMNKVHFKNGLKNNLKNQDNIKQIITDTFKKNDIDDDINLISIACANSIESICKVLDFEFDNHLNDYIFDVLG